MRLDARDNGNRTVSPRGALIHSPWQGASLKLSTGMTHRQPTANEEDGGQLEVERLRSTELALEQQLGARTRLIGSLYTYRIDRRPEWQGASEISTKGFEVEPEHLWDNGIRLRTSYARQNTLDGNGQPLRNVPRHNAKLNLTAPLMGEKARIGLETRYLGGYLYNENLSDFIKEESTLVTDLTLTSAQPLPNWHATLAVRNLFDARLQQSEFFGLPAMDGRNLWLQLSYDFK